MIGVKNPKNREYTKVLERIKHRIQRTWNQINLNFIKNKTSSYMIRESCFQYPEKKKKNHFQTTDLYSAKLAQESN